MKKKRGKDRKPGHVEGFFLFYVCCLDVFSYLNYMNLYDIFTVHNIYSRLCEYLPNYLLMHHLGTSIWKMG